MFSHMACIYHFDFMHCPEPHMGISSVGSFPVWSGGSLNFFQLFRCRNLAINSIFSYFFRGRQVLYLRGCLDAPCTFIHPHTFIHPPYICTPPILFYASVCFWRLCMLWEVVMGSPLYWDTLPYITPILGCLPFITPPHSVVGSLCISMFQGYQYVMWAFPFCQEGFGGVSPISWGVGHQHLRCPYAHSCTFL